MAEFAVAHAAKTKTLFARMGQHSERGIWNGIATIVEKWEQNQQNCPHFSTCHDKQQEAIFEFKDLCK
jgi:hypothetical protein